MILKEINEESGITNIKFLLEYIFSLEMLIVDRYIKKGKYVSSYLHLNLAFSLEVDTTKKLFTKPNKNRDLD